jgi:pimeloyl-ACP methyl ester carboxylesterase
MSDVRSRALATTISSILLAGFAAQGANAQNTQWPPPVAPAGLMDPGPGWPPAVVNVTRPLPGRPFKEGFVDVGGYHIRYIDAGKGEVIVSVPGSGGLEMSTAKDLLSKEYRVIEINPPGWGPDNVLPGTRDVKDIHGAFEVKDMAEIYGELLTKIGVNKFNLIGTSAGCNTALWMVELFPDRVTSFTSEGGECFTHPEDHRVQGPRAIAAQELARKGIWETDYSIWAGWPAYQWAPNKWWQTPSFQARLMRRRYVKQMGTNQFRDQMIADAKSVTIPVIAMVGDRDEIMTQSVGMRWKHDMPQAKFALVAGGTHDIQNSQPEQFVEIMKACALDKSPSRLMCPGD